MSTSPLERTIVKGVSALVAALAFVAPTASYAQNSPAASSGAPSAASPSDPIRVSFNTKQALPSSLNPVKPKLVGDSLKGLVLLPLNMPGIERYPYLKDIPLLARTASSNVSGKDSAKIESSKVKVVNASDKNGSAAAAQSTPEGAEPFAFMKDNDRGLKSDVNPAGRPSDLPMLDKIVSATGSQVLIWELTPQKLEKLADENSFDELFEAARRIYDKELTSMTNVNYPLSELSKKLLTAENLVSYALTKSDVPEDKLNAGLTLLGTIGATAKRYDYRFPGSEPFEKFLAAHADSWRLQLKGAQAFRYRGRGETDYGARGRWLRLRMLRDAAPLVRAEAADETVVEFYRYFCKLLTDGRVPYLDELTDLDAAPEPSGLERDISGHTGMDLGVKFTDPNKVNPYKLGAPTDAEGGPLFFARPDSFEKARNDGERVQALLAELERVARPEVALNARADFAQALFSVKTAQERMLSNYKELYPESDKARGEKSRQTLKDDETIARLASGVKRFALPKDYDYVGLRFEALKSSPDDLDARAQLVEEFASRLQFDKACVQLHAILDGATRLTDAELAKKWNVYAQERLNEYENASLRFIASTIVGLNAELTLNYRNAKSATFVARKLDVDSILEQQIKRANNLSSLSGYFQNIIRLLRCDVLTRSPSDDPELEKTRLDVLKSFGVKDGIRFIGDEVARFDVELTPDPERFVCRKTVPFPIHTPGAYLVEATTDDGARDATVVWLTEYAIVAKAFDHKYRYFVLDSATGAPVPNVEVQYFVVNRWRRPSGRKVGGRDVFTSEYECKVLSLKTDENGSVFFDAAENADPNKIGEEARRLGGESSVVVKTSDPNGFGFAYSQPDQESTLNETEFGLHTTPVFITDQPIYRPGQTVRFHFWAGLPDPNASVEKRTLSGRRFLFEARLSSSDGNESHTYKEEVKLDEFGGYSGSFTIPEDSPSGAYLFEPRNLDEFNYNLPRYMIVVESEEQVAERLAKDRGHVRIDAPQGLIAYGDSFTATVSAQKPDGSPMAGAKVSYCVYRDVYNEFEGPRRIWNGLYDPGELQLTSTSPQYPGSERWNNFLAPTLASVDMRAKPWEQNVDTQPPSELVLSGVGALNSDGALDIKVAASAKSLPLNVDERYTISVEVGDGSAPILASSRSVCVSNCAFRAYAWFDRGHYAPEEPIVASFCARRVDGTPVSGVAKVALYRIEYEEGLDANGKVKANETEVFAKTVDVGADGLGSATLDAQKPGQYRFSCVVETPDGASEETSELLVVRGTDATNFRCFHALEITPDKVGYKVGDVAHIQLASSSPNARVMFVARAKGRTALGTPQFVTLHDGVGYVDVPIESQDVPFANVQASALIDGQWLDTQRRLVVPPENYAIDVAVEPAETTVRQGEKARVKVRLTDPDGKPVVAQTVVRAYDSELAARGAFNGSRERNIRNVWKKRDNTYPMASTVWRYGSFLDAYYPTLPYPFDLNNDESRRLGAAFWSTLGADGTPEDLRDLRFLRGITQAQLEKTLVSGAAESGLRRDPMSSRDELYGVPRRDTTIEPEAKPSKTPDCAFWSTELKPNDDGVLEFEFDAPNEPCSIKIFVDAVGKGFALGSGVAEVVVDGDAK